MREHNSVIALDNNFLPMMRVGREHAIKAVINGRAQIVDLMTWQKSSDITNHVGIKAIVYPQGKIPGDVKVRTRTIGRKILKRDNYECQYDDCTVRADTIDHVIPKAQGGKTVVNNLVACCFKHNQFKANRTPEQAGMKLKRPIRHTRFQLYEEFHKMIETYAKAQDM